MTYLFRNLLCIFCISWLFACSRTNDLPVTASIFTSSPTSKNLSQPVKEVSGITDSKANPGYLWAQEDSENPTRLYLISHNGNVAKSIFLEGPKNRDWEDMTRFNDDLFIADIGDNKQDNATYSIYQISEPEIGADTVYAYKRIRFRYPDGSHDAEALLIEPETRHIYILTKQDKPSRIYKIAYPYKYSETDTAMYAGNTQLEGIVSAALSPDGKEAILKTYSGLYYYKRNSGESLQALLQGSPQNIPYKLEPQGEAITFANNNSGFFTLSEKSFITAQELYFYQRK